jgi:hypothetical protein
MKTRLFFVLSLVVTLFTNTLFAGSGEFTYDLGGGTNVKISAVANAKSIMVSLNNVATEEVSISLQDNDGISFFSEKVKSTPRFAKKYNLSNLEAGSYNVIVTKKAIKTIQPFELTNTSVVLFETEKKEKFLPMVIQNGSKIDVNVLLGNYSNIKVKIYNSEGQIVYDDMNYVVLTLHKRYDLEKLPKGAYVVEVVAGDETQYFTVAR